MPPNILYLTGNGFPRSSSDPRGTFSLEQVKALRSLDAEVHSVDLQADDFGQDSVEGIVIQRIPRLRHIILELNFRRLWKYYSERRRLKTIDYDVVIFSFAYLKYLPLLIGLRRRGVTILVIVMGGEVMPGGAFRRLLKKWFFSMVDVITPISEYSDTLASCLMGRRDADNSRMVTIPCGVDSEKLMIDGDPAALRKKLGIAPNAFVVLSVCNLVKRKGVDAVIHAVSQLQSNGRIIFHVIIGSGVEKENLITLSNTSQTPENFIFIDSVESSHLSTFYRMSNVFALLSTTSWDNHQTEGFGIVYAEAMAVGTPVIGGSGSGVSEPVKHGFTGLLVNPHSSDASEEIAASIARFMDDKEFAERISENGKRHAREHFSWRQNAQATLDVIARVRSKG